MPRSLGQNSEYLFIKAPKSYHKEKKYTPFGHVFVNLLYCLNSPHALSKHYSTKPTQHSLLSIHYKFTIGPPITDNAILNQISFSYNTTVKRAS